MEMPLPPSTSGRTSRLEMMIGFSGSTRPPGLFFGTPVAYGLYSPTAAERPHPRGPPSDSADDRIRPIGKQALHAPTPQFHGAHRIVDRVDGQAEAGFPDVCGPGRRQVLVGAVDADGAEFRRGSRPIRGELPDQQAARHVRSSGTSLAQARAAEA